MLLHPKPYAERAVFEQPEESILCSGNACEQVHRLREDGLTYEEGSV